MGTVGRVRAERRRIPKEFGILLAVAILTTR
jgi:hypothetical protein